MEKTKRTYLSRKPLYSGKVEHPKRTESRKEESERKVIHKIIHTWWTVLHVETSNVNRVESMICNVQEEKLTKSGFFETFFPEI